VAVMFQDGMTVGELRVALAEFDDAMLVVMERRPMDEAPLREVGGRVDRVVLAW